MHDSGLQAEFREFLDGLGRLHKREKATPWRGGGEFPERAVSLEKQCSAQQPLFCRARAARTTGAAETGKEGEAY